ncbi:MAG: non-homologous end-joining DNA ligase [Solirubrobacterales bacterium]|nr:non-homologous end-joining DNA ligase [Solirubrobacterales bacterium]
MAKEYTVVEVAGREVKVSSPGKVYFPERGVTKLALIEYYLEVAEQLLPHLRDRPNVLKRYVDGAAGKPFFQRRVPDNAPDWLHTFELLSAGRPARMLVPDDAAHLAWAVNLGVIDWNPWATHIGDLRHPDELRIDLDPNGAATWNDVRKVALGVNEVLSENGLRGFPKTSGSRGIHINVRIKPEQDAISVRRAALALTREVERRDPEHATSEWWKEKRGDRVFIDYNQNAPDRSVASAYSVRPVSNAQVSTPLSWEEVPDAELADFTIETVPPRIAEVGDLTADMPAASLAGLLELAQRDEDAGLGDAAWPPNYPKMPGEPKRVQPSKARNG